MYISYITWQITNARSNFMRIARCRSRLVDLLYQIACREKQLLWLNQVSTDVKRGGFPGVASCAGIPCPYAAGEPPGCSGTRHYPPADHIPWTPRTQIQTTAFLSKLFQCALRTWQVWQTASRCNYYARTTFFIQIILLMLLEVVLPCGVFLPRGYGILHILAAL